MRTRRRAHLATPELFISRRPARLASWPRRACSVDPGFTHKGSGPGGFWAELVLGAGGPWPERWGLALWGGQCRSAFFLRVTREQRPLGGFLCSARNGEGVSEELSDLAEVTQPASGPQTHPDRALGLGAGTGSAPGAEAVLAGVFAGPCLTAPASGSTGLSQVY